MMEAALVIGWMGRVLYKHAPPDRSVGSLPDSRDLWDVIWENREHLAGVAHSHPGSGDTGPSHTDLTTFAAVEAALGKRLAWWITTSDRVALVWWDGPNRLDYVQKSVDDPQWISELRSISGYQQKEKSHGR